MENQAWQLFIDTGGTFTDCVSISPEQEVGHLKILSSGRLTGTILEKIDDTTFLIAHNWPTSTDAFEDYAVLIHQHPTPYKVQAIALDKGVLRLKTPCTDAIKPNTHFGLTAYEEAPILAARLITSTPLSEPFPDIQMRLGTTKGTNALLERNGAATALLVTKGFKDILAIGNQTRPDLFALNIEKPEPFSDVIIEVDERINFDGSIDTPLQLTLIEPLLNQLKDLNITTVAISLLNSYINPTHEQQLKANLAPHFDYVSTSTDLFPAIKYLPRTETAVVNAYLSPIMGAYINNIINSLGPGSELKIMNSAGALTNPAVYLPKDSLLSGPAGGIIGAAHVANKAGFQRCLTLDMGGTSTDVARFEDKFDYVYETTVGEAHLYAQSLAIETVAAGGGSICHFNGKSLEVGPQSAGAYPGPACYGNNGPLAITDINLLAGRIIPEHFGIPISLPEAKTAIFNMLAEVNAADGQASEHDLLLGFLKIANQKMANAVRKISLGKGFDPADYALLGFGGAAGQHACDIAEELNITELLIPAYGSLLSAEGLRTALLKKTITQQVLKPLEDGQFLKDIIKRMSAEALDLVANEGVNRPIIESINIHLRLKGQDSTIEINFATLEALPSQFKESYISLYGHWVERPIEVESIKVIASEPAAPTPDVLPEIKTYTPAAISHHEVLFEAGLLNTPLYDWDSLQPGAAIQGPALLVNAFTTVVINPSWQLVNHDGFATAKYAKKVSELGSYNDNQQQEVVIIELYTNRFKSVADQMGAILQRTALSVNIKERVDFSCALLDAEGYLVVNAPHIPVHLGSLGICTRAVMQSIDIQKGDVIITNHPGYGGSHLPDVTLIAPVHDGDTLVGYVANRAHHAEIGGKSPGSMPADATTLAEEGVVIQPQHLVKAGQAQWASIESLLTEGPYPSRTPVENLADLEASLASISAGQAALIELCSNYGKQQVATYMSKLRNLTSDQIMQKLPSLLSGTCAAEEHLDDGSSIVVKITLKDRLTIDFSGTSSVHPGNLNATPAIVNGAVIYVLRILSGAEIPLNEGIMDKVDLILPNSLLNPDFPEEADQCPAVVGGNTEVSQRLVDTLLKAFGGIACGQGTMNNFLFGNQHFGYYETIGGGAGAMNGHHGADAVHQHMTNTQITDPEILEFRYPVKLKEFAIRQNSGGDGEYIGGNGITRTFEFEAPLTVTMLSQHRVEAPFGLDGGQPGAVGKQLLTDRNGKQTSVSGISTFEVKKGEAFTIYTPGGGGYGKKKAF